MKLAALGIVTLVLGLVLGVPGLILAGALWVPLGLGVRIVATRRREAAGRDRDAGDEGTAAAGPTARSASPGFLGATLLLLAVGLPSLAIGIFEVGFSEPDLEWRWLPIAVGALASGIAVLGGVLYLAGSGLEAVADGPGDPQHPATVRIEGARETGTYINERPRIEFELLVEPRGSPAYRVTKRATVPHTALGRISVGDGFEARVDPEREKSIAIDWDAPLPGGVATDPAERLERLEDLRRRGLLSGPEYDQQRARILASL